MSMLIAALVIVLAPLAWFAIKRMQHADPVASGLRVRRVIVGIGVLLAVRVGLAAPPVMKAALILLAIGALAVWLRRRGQGGGGHGGDGRDDPPEPGPDPSPERLDPEAFDRARADWEHALHKHARD